MGPLRLLWVDLRCWKVDSPLLATVSARYRTDSVADIDRIPDAVERGSPHVLCFDYDYPGLLELRALRQTKSRYPGLPILMLTQYHSEALAVWAFRSRVWDYLVKPVAIRELRERLEALSRVTGSSTRGAREPAYLPAHPIPRDVRFRNPALERRALLPALSYVDAHYDKRIPLDVVARLCGLSRFQFSRLFRREQGITFREFVMRHRIGRALELLRNPHASVSDVAIAVGFEGPSYFSQIFRRYAGTSPSDYRRRHAAPGGSIRAPGAAQASDSVPQQPANGNDPSRA